MKYLFEIIFNPNFIRNGDYIQDVFVAVIGVINCINVQPSIMVVLEFLANIVEQKTLGNIERPRIQGFYEGLSGTILQVVTYAMRSKAESNRFEDSIKVFYSFAIEQCTLKDIGYCDGLILLPTLIKGRPSSLTPSSQT